MYIFLYKTRYLWRTCHNTPISRLAVAPKVTAAEAPRTYLDVCRVCSKDGRAAGIPTSASGSTSIPSSSRLHLLLHSAPPPAPPLDARLAQIRRSGAPPPLHQGKAKSPTLLRCSLPMCVQGVGETGGGKILHPHRHPVTPSAHSRCIGCLARALGGRADGPIARLSCCCCSSRISVLMLAVWFGSMFEGGRAVSRAQIMHR